MWSWVRSFFFFSFITEKETDKTHNYCVIRELRKIPFAPKKAPKPLKINILLYTTKELPPKHNSRIFQEVKHQ